MQKKPVWFHWGQIKYYLCMSQYQNDHNINFIVRPAVDPVDKNPLVSLTKMVALTADGENYFTRLLPCREPDAD